MGTGMGQGLEMKLDYRQLFETTPCFLTVQDRDLRIVAANKHFRRQFGDFMGQYCYHLYKHRSEVCEDCPVVRTFRDGEGHTSQQVVAGLDEREVSVVVHTTPIFNGDNEVHAVMEMSTDITGIKLLQHQLQRSKARYRLIFDEVPCYISIQNRDLGIVDANRRFKEKFGRALGRQCFQVYKHREEECVSCAVRRTFDDGQVHSSEEVVSGMEGAAVHTLVYTAPIRDELGEILNVMEMSTDITPIRQLQSQLEQVGILISTISHGIKGLLTGLDGGVYLVNSGLERDDRQRVDQGWEMLRRNVGRIRDMVMNILFYAKEREPVWERVDALQLTRDVLAVVAERAQEHGINLEGDLATEVGELDADGKALRSMLINLLENALDACRVDKKQERHVVSVTLRGDDASLSWEIADDGIGMDQETRENAFDIFFSAKGMEGTGLGLFVANKIVGAHGGSIRVESEPGQGTRFVVVVPRARDVSAPA
jgi:PAS domain S-box-containing protein